MRRLRFALAALGALVLAAIVAALVATSNHDSDPWVAAAFAIGAGLSFATAGLVALWRRPESSTGFWLAVTGYLWFVGGLTESNASWAWTVGFVAGNLAFVSFATLILGYPDRALQRRDRVLVAVGGTTAVGVNLISALVDETPTTGCPGCPRSAIALTQSEATRDAAVAIGSAIVGIVLVAIALTLVERWLRSSVAQRRLLRPVFLSCGTALVLLLASVVLDTVADRAYSVVWVLFLGTFALVPLTFLSGLLRSRIARASASRLLLELDAGTPLREAIAGALHDPTLTILYRLDEEGRWVDGEGLPAPEPAATPARSVTIVERDGRVVAALEHDPALDAETGVVDAVADVAWLSLQNERLNANLRAQYRYLETLTATAPSLLVTVDVAGRIVDLNHATVRVSGHTHADEIRGRLFWDVFIDPDEREAMRERFLSPDSEYASEYENSFTNARGERVVIDWRSAPVTDESGQVVRVVSGGIDITERKAREAQLQRERDITDTLMQSIPSMVVVVNTEGEIVDSGVDDARAAANRAFSETLGWSDAELVGRNVLELIDRAAAYEATMAIASAANGVATSGIESDWLRADGECLTLAWSATPVADVTERTAALVLISGIDVSERKRQEEEIRASRARIIEAADGARRKLERNLHDGAQQRLVSISVSLRLAESKLETDPAAAANVLAATREELASALDELRELARGIHPAVLTDRGLAAAVEALVTRTPLPVTVSMPDERLPEPVEAAAYYVVSESVANVVKYAHAGAVSIEVSVADGLVSVVVADDGAGGADPGAGTGLRGLADRVAALDGTLTVESPAGAGTRVSASIPLRDASTAAGAPVRAAAATRPAGGS